jgi:hypothetical protein
MCSGVLKAESVDGDRSAIHLFTEDDLLYRGAARRGKDHQHPAYMQRHELPAT